MKRILRICLVSTDASGVRNEQRILVYELRRGSKDSAKQKKICGFFLAMLSRTSLERP